MSRFYAHRVIDSAEVVINLLPIGNIQQPANEAQARPLAGLEPEQQREVWKQAVETAPEGKITACHVVSVKNSFGFSTNQQSKEEIKQREQRNAWKALWQWIRKASTLDPKSAADNCPDAKFARGYIIESEKAVAIIRQFQSRLKKKYMPRKKELASQTAGSYGRQPEKRKL